MTLCSKNNNAAYSSCNTHSAASFAVRSASLKMISSITLIIPSSTMLPSIAVL